MFNKKFMEIKAEVSKTIDNFLSHKKYCETIKREIIYAMKNNKHSCTWRKTYPEAFDISDMCTAEYIENNLNYFKNKGFEIERHEGYVVIKW